MDGNLLFHDFLRVSYAGVYGQELPAFNKVYEAELADVNRLLGNTDSTVSTQTELEGYTGGGYVTGLSDRMVTEGGGIRNTVVVDESGLYNITLRYQADEAGQANIYVGNTAITLDRINKAVSLQKGDGWQEVTASVYLQKGINIVDLDTDVPAFPEDFIRIVHYHLFDVDILHLAKHLRRVDNRILHLQVVGIPKRRAASDGEVTILDIETMHMPEGIIPLETAVGRADVAALFDG